MGSVTIADTTVRVDGSSNAVQIQQAASVTNPGKVTCDRLTVTGDAPGSTWREAIRCNRDGCEFTDLTVSQPGPDRRDGLLVNGNNVRTVGGRYEATRWPVVQNENAFVDDIYADSLDDASVVRLSDGWQNATITDSTLLGGFGNASSCPGLTTAGNQYS